MIGTCFKSPFLKLTDRLRVQQQLNSLWNLLLVNIVYSKGVWLCSRTSALCLLCGTEFFKRLSTGINLVFIIRLYLVLVRKPSKVPCHWTSICSPYFPKTYEWTQKNINNLVLKNISVRSTVIFFIKIFLSWKQSFPDYTSWITLNILFSTPYTKYYGKCRIF